MSEGFYSFAGGIGVTETYTPTGKVVQIFIPNGMLPEIAMDVVPDGWRMTEKQQIVWDWAAAHGLTLVADECNDLLWKLLLVEEK